MKTTDRGVSLPMMLGFVIVGLGIASLCIDVGSMMMIRTEGFSAADNSAHRGLREIVWDDYVFMAPLFYTGNWINHVRFTEARDASRDLALRHSMGWTAGSAPYQVDLQANGTNDPDGDIVLGRWYLDPATGRYALNSTAAPFSTNDQIPNAIAITARRHLGSRVPGLREGENAVPFMFGQINKPGESGMEMTTTSIARCVPAAIIGRGEIVPVYRSGMPGQTAATGVMPIALRYEGHFERMDTGALVTVGEVLADPATYYPVRLRARITPDGTAALANGVGYWDSLYWCSENLDTEGDRDDATARDRMLHRLAFLARVPSPAIQESPPETGLADTLNGPGQGDGPSLNHGAPPNDDINQLRLALEELWHTTMVIPVVRATDRDPGPFDTTRRTIGFIRIFLNDMPSLNLDADPQLEAQDLKFFLAPSLPVRNAGTYETWLRRGNPVINSFIREDYHSAAFWRPEDPPGGPIERYFGIASATQILQYSE